jgi:hypothetical protein
VHLEEWCVSVKIKTSKKGKYLYPQPTVRLGVVMAMKTKITMMISKMKIFITNIVAVDVAQFSYVSFDRNSRSAHKTSAKDLQ